MSTLEQKKEKLEELVAKIKTCQLCPLYKNTTNAVPGEGNPNADILFIGEGPGKKEDELGRPFVGAAGKLLEALLQHIGLTRNDVFIANVVKHRPPGNRDPLPEEVTACWPYLQKQVEIIAPKIIVLLGRHSLARFLPELAIGKAHGKPFRKDKLVYYPMYHPAAALYNGSLREVMFQDASRIPLILKKINKTS
ncbi:MAG: uracil-DNA glycosylase [bacterium]|nr:uracil-DNA glycosylase [bacterium]